jgi:hypothetical protein
MVLDKELFQYEKCKTGEKYEYGQQTVMMFPVPVPQGSDPDNKGESDHPRLKCHILNNVYPE